MTPSASSFRTELLAAFAAEYREHLAAIREALAEDAEGAAALEAPALREVFRRAHSLKGAARAVDLPGLEAVAHRVESILAGAMEAAAGGPAHLPAPRVALLHRALDAIEAQALAAAAGGEPPPVEAVLAALDGAPEPPAAPSPTPAPTLAPTPTPVPAPESHLRIEAARVDRLAAAAHGLKALLQRGDTTAGLRGVEAELRALRRGWDGLRAALPPADPSLLPRLRGFDAALGEVTRRVAALSRQGRAAEDALDRAATALREEVEAIALLPAGSVLGPLAAAAREMAREGGREVAVRAEGMEVQAERRVLQALKDPVLHLLRNALGHGAHRIPPGDGRRAEIGLRVEASGGGLTVTVWDNGPGPDLAAIEAQAVRQGLLPDRAPGEAPPAPDHLLALVFAPGFSTATAVSHLSGRGMGLSVVAEAAMALHGAAALRPRAGGGAELVIALPPSTGRRALLLVEAGGQVLGLPGGHGLVTVGPLLRIPPGAMTTAEGRPVARLTLEGAEALVPLVPLAPLLGHPAEDPAAPSPAGPVPAVLLARGAARLALTVTALRDARSLVVSEVDAPGLDRGLVSGAALLEEEAVALVLRPDGLLDRGLREAARPRPGAPPPRPAAPGAGRRHVLVVDDSITTRTLERSILEAGGYRVTLAVDGVDALNSLRDPGASVDLVLADVEMPRMDGFGLVEAIRADPALSGLPVILMTSRDSPGDVQRGMELGASAYLTKQTFDGPTLLATLGQLL